MSFDAWLDESESGEGKGKATLTSDKIRQFAKKRVQKMFTE